MKNEQYNFPIQIVFLRNHFDILVVENTPDTLKAISKLNKSNPGHVEGHMLHLN